MVAIEKSPVSQDRDRQPWQDAFPWVPMDTRFKVCEKHKEEFFAEYEDARTDMKGKCILCYPPENDSLGG
jgi:hypothetical protein